MPQQFTDNARALLTSGISAGDLSLTVEAAKADRFPSANTTNWATPLNFFKLVLIDSAGNREVIKVGTRSLGSAVMGNILRGQDGTVARAFTSGTSQTGTAVICAFVAQDAADMTAVIAGKRAASDFSLLAASGSFTVPAGRTTIYVSGAAGGAGGGSGCSGAPGAPGTLGYGAGGGGAGQSVRRVPVSVVPGQVIAATVGAAGTGGVAPTQSPSVTVAGNAGTAGGATVFGAINLLGGSPGGGGPTGVRGNSLAVAEKGGTRGAGFPGGQTGSVHGGAGGSSLFGVGGNGGGGSVEGDSVAVVPNSAGDPAIGYGAGGGGGGAATYNAPIGKAGGAGAPGFLLIEW